MCEDKLAHLREFDHTQFYITMYTYICTYICIQYTYIHNAYLCILITVTIRNVGDITSFADNYHAEQLKNACLQFICLNLAPLLEGRYAQYHYFVYCVYKDTQHIFVVIFIIMWVHAYIHIILRKTADI